MFGFRHWCALKFATTTNLEGRYWLLRTSLLEALQQGEKFYTESSFWKAWVCKTEQLHKTHKPNFHNFAMVVAAYLHLRVLDERIWCDVDSLRCNWCTVERAGKGNLKTFSCSLALSLGAEIVSFTSFQLGVLIMELWRIMCFSENWDAFESSGW